MLNRGVNAGMHAAMMMRYCSTATQAVKGTIVQGRSVVDVRVCRFVVFIIAAIIALVFLLEEISSLRGGS
jgi:hypothetical protein